MAIGIGIGLPFRRGGVNIPFQSNLAQRGAELSGIELFDSNSNKIADVLLPYLRLETTSKYAVRTDTDNTFDIGSNNFTFASWIKSETNSVPSVAYCFAGKYTSTSVNGRWGIIATSNGKYTFNAQSSGGLKSITSEVLCTDLAWHFHVLEIDQALSKLYYYIDNILIGEIAYTGTFANLNSVYEFYLGIANGANGSGTQFGVPMSISDTYLFKRLLSPSEKNNLYNRQHVTGAVAHYHMLGSSFSDTTVEVRNLNIVHDSSGNGNHLYCPAVTRRNYMYSEYGSRYGVNNGYTRHTNGFETIFVGLDDNGNEVNLIGTVEGALVLPKGFYKLRNHTGNFQKHNLCNSVVKFTGARFDRSNATYWNDLGRDATVTGYYNAASPKDFHIEELNNLEFYNWSQTGENGKIFVKIDGNSYGVRKTLMDLLIYNTNKQNTDYEKVMKYLSDINSSGNKYNDFIEWKYITDNIVAARFDKMVKFNGATNTISLSVDNGQTYNSGVIISGLTEVQFCHICESGVIAFASSTKIYRSTDNLNSAIEITPTVNGVAYVPRATNNYAQLVKDNYLTIGGKEMVIWGAYVDNANLSNTKVHAWYSIDDFATIKSAYECGVTGAPITTYAARHIHAVNYINGKFILQTGDGTNTCNWIEGTYDDMNDLFSWNWVAGDNVSSTNYTNNTYYKTAGVKTNQTIGKVFIGSDSNDTVNKSGINSVDYADIYNQANYVNLHPFPYKSPLCLSMLVENDKLIATSGGGIKYICTSIDLINFKGNRLYDIPDLSDENNSFFCVFPKNNNGYHLIYVYEKNETLVNMYLKGVVLLKFKS